MIYGYARVSSKGQEKYGNSLDSQENELRNNGCTIIYRESITGTKRHRPQLDELLSVIAEGDTIVVTKLDRIARNTQNGIDIIDEIVSKGCKVNILNMGMFDNTPAGRMIRTVMLAFAEFERDMIAQRTAEGKEVARATKEGWREGRPKKETPDFQKFFKKQKDGLMTVDECCRELNISRSLWYSKVRSIA